MLYYAYKSSSIGAFFQNTIDILTKNNPITISSSVEPSPNVYLSEERPILKNGEFNLLNSNANVISKESIVPHTIDNIRRNNKQ